MDSDNAPWQYRPSGDDSDVQDTGPVESSDSSALGRKQASISWQATEFIEHPHNAAWYAGLVLVTAALTGLVYLITKDFIATGTILIVGIIVGFFAKHRPGLVEYEVSASGLKVGPKNYPYHLFKSFAVFQEGDLKSANLFPLRRFMPPITAYFEPADEAKIVKALGDHLPYVERKMDGIDRLTRRLRL
ncbi:MAG TPA: hypothetical protein VFK97_00660 [Candidatus Saccharimonadales bacterium]|nr:hypothetical protein [Candidatus Saccharimonadales bacterium]